MLLWFDTFVKSRFWQVDNIDASRIFWYVNCIQLSLRNFAKKNLSQGRRIANVMCKTQASIRIHVTVRHFTPDTTKSGVLRTLFYIIYIHPISQVMGFLPESTITKNHTCITCSFQGILPESKEGGIFSPNRNPTKFPWNNLSHWTKFPTNFKNGRKYSISAQITMHCCMQYDGRFEEKWAK